jgi:hypothetical protein
VAAFQCSGIRMPPFRYSKRSSACNCCFRGPARSSSFTERSTPGRWWSVLIPTFLLKLGNCSVRICKNITVAESCFCTVAEMACGIRLLTITICQIRDCAAQESPGDRVPVPGAFDSSDPVAGTHVFHRNLYFPSRDNWRRLGHPDCSCRIRMLQLLPRIIR